MKTAQRRTARRTTTVKQFMIEMKQKQFGDFRPVESWAPSINMYQLEGRIEVCVDLSGVDARRIEVRVEPGKLSISGFRNPPEPARRKGEAMRIVTMEIDHGRFCRTIALPDFVDIERAESEYAAGLLWVRLPVHKG